MADDCGKPTREDSEIGLMLLIAYVTMAGIALIEAVTLPFGPPAVLTLAFIVVFALLLSLRKAVRLPKAWVVADAAVQTALAIGVMLLGTSWMLGGVLFYIICASLAYELPLPFVYSWKAVAFISVFASSLIVERKFEWGVLPFCLGISSTSALSTLLHRARESREESLRLIGELEEAQGRLRELAIVEERQRLARDIHDAVGYRLTASSMLLESAARFVRSDPDRAVRLLETSRDQVREGLAELRTAVRALREEGAEKPPLAAILGAMVDVYAQSARAEVSLRVADGLPEPDMDRELVLVRTVQEALTNAQKHSGASRVELSLGFEGGTYELDCRDNGRGPDRRGCQFEGPAASPGSGAAEARGGSESEYGYGLGNLRKRAADFGGFVQLLPAKGGGAILQLRLPAGGEATDGN
jgi:signal transduction histidine kinase